MLSILINAYACCPNMGSEPGMAWNWCVNLANYCELYIITEGEFRDKIEAVVPTLQQGKNMHFYYNPVSDQVRKMCWNQGDWRFYWYYKKWQKKTLLIAQDIISHNKIDIVHQLNMVGFREPGYLWKIKNIPFVWGPIGGLKTFPVAYLRGASFKMKIFNRIKNFVNVLQIKYSRRVFKALHSASLLVSSIPDSYKRIKQYQKLESIIIPETGCVLYSDKENDLKRFVRPTFDIIWVGKFDFRKQLPIALETIAALSEDKNVILHIYGNGTKQQIIDNKYLIEQLGISDKIKWHGEISNDLLLEKMKNALLFFFTSVDEDTSTVVLEALSCGVPILCHDACGFGYVVNDDVGIKVPLCDKRRSIISFTNAINKLYKDRNLLIKLSENCKNRVNALSWDEKIRKMVSLYEKILKDKECLQ